MLRIIRASLKSCIWRQGRHEEEYLGTPANDDTRMIDVAILQGPVARKPINANPRLKINQGVYFSTPKCCTTLIFGKILH